MLVNLKPEIEKGSAPIFRGLTALFQYKLRDTLNMCGVYVATQGMLVGLSTFKS